MRRHFAVLLFFIIASAAFAGEPFNQVPLAEGWVTSVDPYLRSVTIQGGQITIDITSAEVRDAYNQPTSPTNLRPGVHVNAVIRPGEYGPGDALSASVIQILQQPNGLITGKVESVDTATGSFVVLGQRIYTSQYTVFRGSVPDHDPHSLADLQIGSTVSVTPDGNLMILRAQVIYTLPPTFEDSNIVFNSTLTKVNGNTWTVRPVKMNDLTITSFNVVSGTSIQDFIRPGDAIEVFARVDGDQVTAVSIRLSRAQCPNFQPFPVLAMHGTIAAISDTSVTIVEYEGTSVTIQLDDSTVYTLNDPMVGDYVSIEAEKHGETYIARSIQLEQIPYDVDVVDTVKSIDGDTWTIGTHVVTVNRRTEITGDPKGGDRVHLIAINTSPTHTLALRIDKQQ